MRPSRGSRYYLLVAGKQEEFRLIFSFFPALGSSCEYTAEDPTRPHLLPA
jgi:hypothetical protein